MTMLTEAIPVLQCESCSARLVVGPGPKVHRYIMDRMRALVDEAVRLGWTRKEGEPDEHGYPARLDYCPKCTENGGDDE